MASVAFNNIGSCWNRFLLVVRTEKGQEPWPVPQEGNACPVTLGSADKDLAARGWAGGSE